MLCSLCHGVREIYTDGRHVPCTGCTRPCQWCGETTPNSNACDPCWEIQRQVVNAPRDILRAMVERCAPSVAAEFRRAGFDIARDNVTAQAGGYAEGQASHVELDWTGAEAELERINKEGL